jgi:hypothetical protein
MHRPTILDDRELESIAGSSEGVFTPQNMQNFESEFMKYVGFGCPNLDLGPDASMFIY